jgi:putative Mg2+ transporter-C (MgtC) family protein
MTNGSFHSSFVVRYFWEWRLHVVLELWILLRLVIASILSGLIGYEREYTGKQAGLRTHMLVAVGAALFVSFNDLFALESMPLAPPGAAGNFRVQIQPLSIVEAIVTGVSFLGAGTIFVSGRVGRVKGLTTAASLWVTAAVGIAVGLERYVLAGGATLLILVILHIMHRFEAPHNEDNSAAHEDRQGFKRAGTPRPK